MAVRNGERFLAEAIQSVLDQDYRPLQIIVIDGHSSDGTARVADGFPAVEYHLQNELGIPNAYNQGLDAARGDFIAFLSHDDRWAPGKVRKQMALLQAHPEIAFTICKVRFFLQPGCVFPASLRPEILVEERPLRIMETLLARRSAFERVGRFDPAFSTAEDVDWYARAGDLGLPLGIVDELLVFKRIHDANSSIQSADNMRHVLAALQRSLQRKRAAAQEQA
jgi:glycosyltransferase involved in cell wall biosynthesis